MPSVVLTSGQENRIYEKLRSIIALETEPVKFYFREPEVEDLARRMVRAIQEELRQG